MVCRFSHLVLAMPYLVHASEDVEVFEDQDIELDCITSGVPKPIIAWTSNGKPLNGSFISATALL